MSPYAKAWRLAWPVILSGLSVPLLGAVDTAVMGHLPDAAYLGAVAVGALVFDFVYWGFGFLRMGTTGFAAQAHGAGDAVAVKLALLRPLGLALGLGGLLWALQGPIEAVAFRLVSAGPEIAPLARAYFRVRIWAAPAVLVNYAVLGWLLGTQRPRHALAVQVAVNGLNLGLDLLFVQGFGWGVVGVAAATAIAQGLGALLGALVVWRALRPLQAPVPPGALWDREALGALWRVNRDLFIRTLALIGAFAWFTTQGAAQGKVILAANAVLLNLQTLMAYGLDGFAHAAEALVGDALGARAPSRLRAALRGTLGLSVAIALAFTAAWALAGSAVVDLLTDLPAVRATARDYLPWAVASPLVSVWCFWLDGVFIGATHTRAMRDGMVLSLLGDLAVAALAQPLWGNHGLWLGLLTFFALRGLTLCARLPTLIRDVQRPGAPASPA
ncbi:MAG: MATE family efflux transporter [Myxococcales bacterium]|nr:MATE family efflux transporter [Myxococcales bacterium]